jgi:REP element-mobilizing transposase RayT
MPTLPRPDTEGRRKRRWWAVPTLQGKPGSPLKVSEGGHCLPISPMSQYRRVRIPGGTYFFTVVTHRRRPFLTKSWSQSIVSQVLREVQARAPFVVEAWVFLPDHWHCIWTLPEGDSDYSKRWGLIKAGFSKRALPLLERGRAVSGNSIASKNGGHLAETLLGTCHSG